MIGGEPGRRRGPGDRAPGFDGPCERPSGFDGPHECASGFDGPGEWPSGFHGPGLDCPHCCCGAGAGCLRGPEADLGDVVVTLLVGTLAGLRDRLYADGFETAASVIQDLVEVADDYVSRLAP